MVLNYLRRVAACKTSHSKYGLSFKSSQLNSWCFYTGIILKPTKMKQEIISIIKDLVGHRFLYFDTALAIKLSPHSWPLAIWAICVSPSDQIYVMDNAEEWHELKTSDINYDKVLNSVYQRMKQIKSTYKTAV